MPTVFMERMDDLGCSERLGVIRSLTIKARVVWSSEETPPQNFNILKAALDAVPQPFTAPPSIKLPFVQNSQASITDPLEPFGNLVLVGRDPRVAEDDPNCVDVTLHYEHIMDGPNQSFDSPTKGIVFVKGKSSIVDKTTNFYYPGGDRSKPRQVIEVSHTFPDWEKGILGLSTDPQYPRTVFQGGEVSIPFPQSNFGMQGTMSLTNPVEESFKFIGKINKIRWMGGNPRQWICSEMQWEYIGVAPGAAANLYKASFEFQFNIDTWWPTVAFNDSRTGRPPADVESASLNDTQGVMRLRIHPFVPVSVPAGIWDVPAVEEADFQQLFGFFFAGSQPPPQFE